MEPLEHVKVIPLGGGVVEVRMDRPEKRNAMNKRLWSELGTVFSSVIPQDPTARCVILTGSGKLFSSGIDVSAMGFGAIGDESGGKDPALRGMRVLQEGAEWQAAWKAVNNCRVPVIAAVHTGCYGAALELIAWADVRMCTADTVFRAPEVDVGLAADIGGNQMLPKIVGNDSLLRELMLSARPMHAAEALQFGLVSRVLQDKEALMAAALELATTIAKKSPVAVMGVKTLLNYTRDHTVDDSLRFGLTWNATMLQSSDVKAAGIAFAMKQEPTFDNLRGAPSTSKL